MQALIPDTRLGRFTLLSPLGKGGMGEVWKARDERLGREVAIKILPTELANEELRIRFQRESKLLAALNHANIAQIYEADEEFPVTKTSTGSEKVAFLVMELVDGQSLAQMLSSGPLPLLAAIRLGRQIARALGAAHKAGIIHRDLKPANIMVTPRNQVKVLDFGLARPTGKGMGSAFAAMPEVTVSGMVLGTAAFLSPEQVRGTAADHRSDIWALGCVLYQMLGGKRPFAGDSIPDILASVLRDEPQDLASLAKETPASLSSMVMKCLSKDPDSRPASASSIASSLKDIFHQIRPGSPAHTPEAIDNSAEQPSLKSIDMVNAYLRSIQSSFPTLVVTSAGPAFAEITHRGAKIGILLSSRPDRRSDLVAFVAPLFSYAGKESSGLFRKLLSLSNGHTDVCQYALDPEARMVNATCIRSCDSIDASQFFHTLNAISDAASLATAVQREFSIS